jgi:hypothetical protein
MSLFFLYELHQRSAGAYTFKGDKLRAKETRDSLAGRVGSITHFNIDERDEHNIVGGIVLE